MYINSLNIKNLRCFREAKIELQHPDKKNSLRFKNINLLLGNNGSGKSSILKGLALASLSPILEKSSGLVLYRMIRNVGVTNERPEDTQLSAKLLLHRQDLEGFNQKRTQTFKMDSVISKRGDIEELRSLSAYEEVPIGMFENNSPAFLMVGYGVTRRVEETSNYNFKEQSRIRLLRYSRVASLFENNYGLVPLQSWLPQLESENKGRYVQVVHLIDRITPPEMIFEGEFRNDEFYFNFRGSKVPFGALSDGYRHFVGWIADLLYHICMGCPDNTRLDENKGVVLVDEIDLLLHPEWQRNVIESLSKNLSKIQFVFTTHSPIVASSVEKENIFVMETDSDGSALVRQYDEGVYGLTSEQVLLSDYFGLKTTRAESFVKNELEPLSNRAIFGDNEAALEMMRKLSEPIEIKKSKFDNILKKI